MRLDSIDIIFLDAGRTLLHLSRDVGEVYAGAAARHGLALRPADVQAAFGRAFAAKREEGGVQTREWWRDVVRRTFAPFDPPIDLEPVFDDLYEHFARPDAYSLLPGAVEAVREIRARGYRTALISNWDDRLPPALEGLGLAELLDPVVISYRVGAEKPDPLIFQVALTEAGVPAERGLMVGDDFEADCMGAAGVGMRSVLVGDGADLPPEGPWVALPAVSDLPGLLPGR